MRPRQSEYYMPGEWHPHARCWMAWPSHKKTWEKIGLQRAREAFATVAKAISQFEPVAMLVNPNELEGAAKLCGSAIQLFPLALNDSWTRDTGPTFLLNGKGGRLAGVNWTHNAWGGNYDDYANDQKIAEFILKHVHAQTFHAPLIMEGGAFHVDGEGTVLTTRECLLNANRNPQLSKNEIERLLCDYLGCDTIIWLNQGLVGDETDGHIDEIACFIAPGKVLALITEDESDENYQRLQDNLTLLKEAIDSKGRKFEVFTVEQPPATYLHGERLTLSYINFYRANKGIVMPAFGYEVHDKAAYELFKKLFSNDKITQIKALDVFAGGGGIHCITQQEPKIN